MKIMKAKDIDYGTNISVRLNSRLIYMNYANVDIPYEEFLHEMSREHPYFLGFDRA